MPHYSFHAVQVKIRPLWQPRDLQFKSCVCLEKIPLMPQRAIAALYEYSVLPFRNQYCIAVVYPDGLVICLYYVSYAHNEGSSERAFRRLTMTP